MHTRGLVPSPSCSRAMGPVEYMFQKALNLFILDDDVRQALYIVKVQ